MGWVHSIYNKMKVLEYNTHKHKKYKKQKHKNKEQWKRGGNTFTYEWSDHTDTNTTTNKED